MNVFVLSTGRTGSLSLEKACQKMTNYTVSHESKCQRIGEDRIKFPDNHIEIDNRLSWYLGRLDKIYSHNAFYVHMIRDRETTANSYLKRWNRETGIIRAFAYGIQKRQEHEIRNPLDICLEYVDCVNENIESFLKDKPNKMIFNLDSAEQDFKRLWDMIHATGNLSEALAVLSEKHNTSDQNMELHKNTLNKFLRIIKKFPSYIKNA